jgi:hypothetical protein
MVEIGNREDPIKAGGVYADIYYSQFMNEAV